MSSDISSDQIEIINEFIQETRDMLDNLEPTIIELGQSCQKVDCWTALDCSATDCPRHGKTLPSPCWLHMGYVGDGEQTCPYADSEKGCFSCKVFGMTNGDVDTLNAIFRLFHSMKGSAGFLDLEHVAHVAHQAENLLDLVRSGRILLQAEHVDLLCRSCDFARSALEFIETNYHDQGMAELAHETSTQWENAVAEAQARAAAFGSEPAEAPNIESESKSIPAPDLESLLTAEMVERFILEGDELLLSAEQGLLKWSDNQADAELLGALFRDIHSFKGNCGFFGYRDLEQLSHQMETILDAAKSDGAKTDERSAETLLEMVDVLRAATTDLGQGGSGRIDQLDTHLDSLNRLLNADPAPESKFVDEAPSNSAPSQPAEVAPAVAPAAAPAAATQVAPPVPPPVKNNLQGKGNSKPPTGGATKGNAKRQDIRVDLEKLDNLINLIGEMVIAENMLIHNPDLQGLELENFNRAAQQMGKIVRELQEMAMLIRMIPVSGLFRRMIRLVHDISLKSGKKVELRLSGEETEVDKTVIETITDPLVHLLRNSLDHGLETPEERREKGKPEKGVIQLTACHEEGEVWITVQDDGRGLNRDKILAKAIGKGLVQGDGSELSDRAVFNLIFQPGFSTAEKVTDISGRGVGMDVVKQNLEKIKGKIEINSKEGDGTRIRLRIPLTLAIIEGMLVRVGHSKCILPLLAIREIFRPTPEAITVTPEQQEIVRIRDNFFPVLRLHQVLQKEATAKDLHDGILVLVEYQNSGLCLLVDEILGQQQTVIKGLSDYFGNVHCVSGCTILGNGEVCLIFDIGSLVEMKEEKQKRA